MNRRVLFTLVVGTFVVAITVAATYPRADSKPPAADTSRFRFMHCPECDRETKYSSREVDERCPRCDKKMIPTIESIAVTGKHNSRFKLMFALVLMKLCAIMAAALLVKHLPGQLQNEFYYVNCQKCGQKIRYNEGKVGRSAACPRCKGMFTFPPVSDEIYA
jgi:ribosomal protein S27E